MTSVWIVEYDLSLDCCHDKIVVIYATEEEAKSYVESKGKYSGYSYYEVVLGELAKW